MTDLIAEMTSTLEDYLRGACPRWPDPHVLHLASINAGWESDVYAFELEFGPATAREAAPLVLRVYPGADAWWKSAHEYRGMTLLQQADYPVPAVYLLERDASPFGKPFMVMERVSGESLWPLLFHGPEANRSRLLTLFCGLLLRLHTLDWRVFTEGPTAADSHDPVALIDRELGRWEAVYERYPLPGFAPTLDWLRAARTDLVTSPQPGPVHWDFHPANVLVRSDGTATVLDWTQNDISDTRFDLAWTLLLIGSTEGMEWRERVLREYERLRGAPVESLAFFEAAACLKRLFSFAISVSFGAEKLGMRPGAEELMKAGVSSQRAVYSQLMTYTGLRVPELDALL